jgi:hypothetical protein
MVPTTDYGIPIVQTRDYTYYQLDAKHCVRETVLVDGVPTYKTDCIPFRLVPCMEANLNEDLVKVLNFHHFSKWISTKNS